MKPRVLANKMKTYNNSGRITVVLRVNPLHIYFLVDLSSECRHGYYDTYTYTYYDFDIAVNCTAYIYCTSGTCGHRVCDNDKMYMIEQDACHFPNVTYCDSKLSLCQNTDTTKSPLTTSTHAGE